MPEHAYKFEIYRDWRREFQWRLVSDDGHVLGRSNDGYQSSEAAELVIQALQSKIVDAKILVCR